MDNRAVDANHQAIDRVGIFRRDFATDKPAHQNRHQGNRKKSCRAHGIGLGESQRLKQPP